MTQSIPERALEPAVDLIRQLRSTTALTQEQLQHALTFQRPLAPASELRDWDKLQICPAQLATKPLLETANVLADVTLGRSDKSQLRLVSPLLVELDPSGQETFGWLDVSDSGLVLVKHEGDFETARRCVYARLSFIEKYSALFGSLGVPVGVRIDDRQLDEDIRKAVAHAVDFIVLDGGSNCVATLGRARRRLAEIGVVGRVQLVLAGDLALPADFAKALALGASAVIVGSSATRLIAAMDVAGRPSHFETFVDNATELLKVMARACGHSALSAFGPSDLTTWHPDVAASAGVEFSGAVESKAGTHD